MRFILFLFAFGFASPFSWAHSKLRSLEISCTGEHSTIKLEFSAPVEIAFSRFSLKAERSAHDAINLQALTEVNRVKALELRAPKLEAGRYTFFGTILSADGHRQEESRGIEVK